MTQTLNDYKKTLKEWVGKDIGTEWSQPTLDVNPLTPEQINFLNSEIVRNVQIGNYLGSGSFGKVFKVSAEVQVESNKWVRQRLAGKVIRHKTSKMDDIMLSFAGIAILRTIRHQNICNMIDSFGIPDPKTNFPFAFIFLLMEYCDGDLNKFRLEGRRCAQKKSFEMWTFPEQLSQWWFSQIATAVHYIHSHCIAHRDIKQHNILYCLGNFKSDTFEERFLSSTFKLTDFGMSVRTQENGSDAMHFDYQRMALVLYRSGVPGPRDFISEKLFMDKCLYQNWNDMDPKEWNTVSHEMKDLIGKMFAYRMTASQIVAHPWLVNTR